MSKKKDAFTIIELIVALVIIGVASVFSAVALNGALRREHLGKVTKSVVDIAREARLAALTDGSNIELLLDPSSGTFLMTVRAVGQDKPPRLGKFVLDSGASFSAHVRRVRWLWRSDGSADGDTLLIHEGDGQTARVLVDPSTGAPHIELP